MSGSGGGKPGARAFWDSDKEQEFFVDNGTGFTSYEGIISDMKSHIEKLEKRIEQLETAYMEKAILGEDNG